MRNNRNNGTILRTGETRNNPFLTRPQVLPASLEVLVQTLSLPTDLKEVLLPRRCCSVCAGLLSISPNNASLLALGIPVGADLCALLDLLRVQA